jgi:hypothetical protein
MVPDGLELDMTAPAFAATAQAQLPSYRRAA